MDATTKQPSSTHAGLYRAIALTFVAVLLAGASGCGSFLPPAIPEPVTPSPPSPLVPTPREMSKVTMPTYTIEPPDIILIDALRVIPKGPHLIEPFDVLGISVLGAFPDQPIFGNFVVDPSGRVDLGPAYGTVEVVGKTVDEVRAAIDAHLRQLLTEPQITVSLNATAGAQQIAGQHLVAPDGTVNLGSYGMVYIAGMTIPQAKQAIEEHLSAFLLDPEVIVDVFSYNSKVYYIITEGAGFGDNVVRLPITGNETVLDAISQIGGLSQISSTQIWIARPTPNGVGCVQVLPVDWKGITRGGEVATNYQLLPGDRLFIAEDKIVALDSFISTVSRPFERIFGFTLLGAQALERLNRIGQ